MGLRTILPIALLGFIAPAFFLTTAAAQLPRRLERCLPYPTLAQEISEMKTEVQAKTELASKGTQEGEESDAPERKVTIDEVRFVGLTHLPESTRAEIAVELMEHEFPAGSNWVEEFEEVGVQGAFQHRGYFKVEATAEAHPIGSDPTRDHVSVTIHVREGLRYQVGEVRFRTADPEEPLAFSADELRKQVPMQPGDIFNVAKIREGLEALRKFYSSKGYIDFVPEPLTEIDDANQRISLIVVLWQGKQYRVGRVEVFGPDSKTEEFLKSLIKSGEPYNAELIKNILKLNRSVLPDDVSSEDIEPHKHVREGTVDLRFNFQTCPQIPD